MNDVQLRQFRLGVDCFHADHIPFQNEPFFIAGMEFARREFEAFMRYVNTPERWTLNGELPTLLSRQVRDENAQRIYNENADQAILAIVEEIDNVP